jgi:hypothetical protein
MTATMASVEATAAAAVSRVRIGALRHRRSTVEIP